MAKFYRCELKAFTRFLPPRIVTNYDLSTKMDTSDAWISERTGIKERRFADPEASTSDLAIRAVQDLMTNHSYKATDFDYIIAGTLSPDFYYPGIAPIIQHKLGIPSVPALDIRVQCSAFVYAVEMADAMIRSGQYKKILLVFSDIQSKFLDLSTTGRNVSVLFSDGAAALVCESVECKENELPSGENQISGVIDSILGSDGSGADLLQLPSPGSASKDFLSQKILDNGLWHPKMEGKLVFKHAVKRMCETAEELIKNNHINIDDIAYLIPHQANLRISDAVRERVNLPQEKMFNNIQLYGNTTSATIPICFAEMLEKRMIKKGDLILTVAFGAGFTWGGSLIRL